MSMSRTGLCRYLYQTDDPAEALVASGAACPEGMFPLDKVAEYVDLLRAAGEPLGPHAAARLRGAEIKRVTGALVRPAVDTATGERVIRIARPGEVDGEVVRLWTGEVVVPGLAMLRRLRPSNPKRTGGPLCPAATLDRVRDEYRLQGPPFPTNAA